MELPPDAYIPETRKDAFTLRGNKLNTEGKPEQIEVNQYRMTKFDFTKKIYQYDARFLILPLGNCSIANMSFRSYSLPSLTSSARS